MGIFPQMGFMNKQNESKANAINTAKDLLVAWQSSSKVENFLINKNPDEDFSPNSEDEEVYYYAKDFSNPSYYEFKTKRNNYDATVRIMTSKSTDSKISSVHQIVVEILNNKGKPISESYGYIKGGGR